MTQTGGNESVTLSTLLTQEQSTKPRKRRSVKATAKAPTSMVATTTGTLQSVPKEVAKFDLHVALLRSSVLPLPQT